MDILKIYAIRLKESNQKQQDILPDNIKYNSNNNSIEHPFVSIDLDAILEWKIIITKIRNK